MEVPTSIINLLYTKHSLFARCKDPYAVSIGNYLDGQGTVNCPIVSVCKEQATKIQLVVVDPKIDINDLRQQTLTDFGELMGDLNKQDLQVTYDRQFKVLYIIRGISSCGKTSLAQSLGFPYFEADQYFINEKGEYKFDATKLAKAHNYCKANVEDAMIRGESRIIQSNTNIRISEIQPYLDLAAKYNYKVFSLILEKRHDGVNQHGLKNEKLIQMAERLHSNIKLI